mgnify:CR=1 FL=1
MGFRRKVNHSFNIEERKHLIDLIGISQITVKKPILGMVLYLLQVRQITRIGQRVEVYNDIV